jgi:DNA mismatch repair protein MutS
MDAARPLTPSGFESGPPPADGAPRATPVMEQYIEIKAANPDCLLFYRMGDFYELFFEDAEIAARGLGIVLTKRGKHLGRDIPMCGVPVHRSDEYLTAWRSASNSKIQPKRVSAAARAWCDAT